MNPNRKNNMYASIVILALLAGVWGAHEYQPEDSFVGLKDPISIRKPNQPDTNVVVKRTQVVDMQELELMQHYIDKATEFDHKGFAAKTNFDEARFQDSVVKYRMLIYNLNKSNR